MDENMSELHGVHRYLSWSHPLARVANRHCRTHSGLLALLGGVGGVGGVACGACWERAIRDDERVVIEYDLSRQQCADIDVVDEIAIERACKGERVRLTRVERAAAATVLHNAGLSVYQIANRLHTSSVAIRQALALADQGAADQLAEVA